LREEFEDRWPRLEQAVQTAIEEAVEDEDANAAPAARPVENVLEDVLSAMRDMRLDIQTMQPAPSPRSDWTSRQEQIYGEIMRVLDSEGASVSGIDIKDRPRNSIIVRLSLKPSDDQARVARAKRKLDAIPKYKVIRSTSKRKDARGYSFDNSTPSADGAEIPLRPATISE